MRYVYKHGNQFWYQRAVPVKIQKILGKTSIKISLKTNKISTAIQRSKLQAVEHKKMFRDIIKKNNYFSKVFFKKNMDIKKYELLFTEEYDDLVTNMFFGKNLFFEKIKNQIKNTDIEVFKKRKVNSFENFLFNIQDKSTLFSSLLNEFVKIEHIKNFNIQKKNLNLVLDVCGDKPINEYTSDDYFKFENFLKINNFNDSEILKLVKNFFLFNYKKLNIKEKIKFKKESQITHLLKPKEFDRDELFFIANKCKETADLESLILLLLMDTGCTISEIIGLSEDDIYLDSYLPFIIIRTNHFRKIKNVNKLRTIPLVGSSLWAINKINRHFNKNNFFKMSKLKKNLLKKNVSLKLKQIITDKNLLCFRKSIITRLIEVNCPERVILDIIGQSKKNRLYNEEIGLEVKSSWLNQVSIIDCRKKNDK
jgi:integrase